MGEASQDSLPRASRREEPLSMATAAKNILLIAFHYPPYNLGSGMLRTLKFAKYLPGFAWCPTVLTVNVNAYEAYDAELLHKEQDDKSIIRCFCFDAPKYVSIKGRYPAFIAAPDNYASWIVSGFLKGVAAVQQRKIDVIFSTFPIPSAHVLGYLISRYTGKPWVADFRDPMVQPEEEYPRGKAKRYVWERIEKTTIHKARYVLFTTESAKKYYANRYGTAYEEKFKVIHNGFDEDDMAWHPSARCQTDSKKKITLRHCGVLYQEERDPVQFFQAVKILKERHRLCTQDFVIELYGSGNAVTESYYQNIIDELEIGDLVHLKPRIPYEQMVKTMGETDILLLFQGHGCDYQVPAKIYEYFAVGKPILALTSKDGDSARLVQENKAGFVVDLRQAADIATTLEHILVTLRAGKPLPAITPAAAQQYSRRQQAGELASLLHTLV